MSARSTSSGGAAYPVTGALLFAVCLLAATLPAQTPAAPQTLASSVTLNVQRLRATISFDLPAAGPDARFNVAVSVKVGGQAVLALAFSGDVGPAVLPGPGKRITWSAGRDIETPQFDLYEISVIATPAVGALRIETSPPGATVNVDGEPTPRPGTTPLSIPDLVLGPHRVTLSLTGYLENSYPFTLNAADAGTTKTVTIPLTPIAAQPGAGAGPGRGTAVPSKGGLPKWVLPAAGGGAAAAVFALKGKKTTTTTGNAGPCTFNISQTTFPTPVPQAGGTTPVSITVTPDGCSPSTWSASDGTLSNGLKLTVSATTGTGPQTITVTLPPNNSTATVTTATTAKIAGKDFGLPTSGQPGLPSETLAITGASATFQSFGLQVVAGTKLTITATGCIQTLNNGCVEPKGIGTNAGAQGRLPGAPSFGLICGVPDQLPVNLFYAGLGSIYATGTIADRSGTISCGLNAPDAGSYAGNTLSWSVTIIIGG